MKNYDNHDRNLVFDCDNSRNSDAGRKVERYLPNLIGIIYHDFDEATIPNNWGNEVNIKAKMTSLPWAKFWATKSVLSQHDHNNDHRSILWAIL